MISQAESRGVRAAARTQAVYSNKACAADGRTPRVTEQSGQKAEEEQLLIRADEAGGTSGSQGHLQRFVQALSRPISQASVSRKLSS